MLVLQLIKSIPRYCDSTVPPVLHSAGSHHETSFGWPLSTHTVHVPLPCACFYLPLNGLAGSTGAMSVPHVFVTPLGMLTAGILLFKSTSARVSHEEILSIDLPPS